MQFYDFEDIIDFTKDFSYWSRLMNMALDIGDFVLLADVENQIDVAFIQRARGEEANTLLDFYNQFLVETENVSAYVNACRHMYILNLNSEEVSINNILRIYDDIPNTPYKAYVHDLVTNWSI